MSALVTAESAATGLMLVGLYEIMTAVTDDYDHSVSTGVGQFIAGVVLYTVVYAL